MTGKSYPESIATFPRGVVAEEMSTGERREAFAIGCIDSEEHVLINAGAAMEWIKLTDCRLSAYGTEAHWWPDA